MIRLLRIELRKQVSNSAFWIMIALHAVVIILIALNFNSFLKNANIMINDIPDIDLSLKPILEFPDVWQNITYIAGFFKIILALIIITSVSNEITHGTLRQNIIDGFSRSEWLFSKISLAKVLALFSTLLILGIGFFLGFTQRNTADIQQVFIRMDFVLAYFIELLVYFIYALFLVVVIKRTGLALILLIVYDFILEPIISWSLPDAIDNYLPMKTIDNLNTFPFTKYIGNETLTAVSIEQLVWAIGYGLLFALFTYLILEKKDL